METVALKTLRDVPRSQRRVMSKEETNAFLTASLAQFKGETPLSAVEFSTEMGADDAPFAVKVMAGRLMLADDGCRFAPMTVLFLTSLCSNPAQVVMWAHYLVHRTYELAEGVVDNDVLARDFPMGFPTDEGMSAIWDAQKQAGAPGGNVLDTAAPWKRESAVAA